MTTGVGKRTAEIVIWASTALLGVVVALAAAFFFWMQLPHTADPGLLTVAVIMISTGLALVAVSAGSVSARLFLATAALTLCLAFLTGSGAFASITS